MSGLTACQPYISTGMKRQPGISRAAHPDFFLNCTETRLTDYFLIIWCEDCLCCWRPPPVYHVRPRPCASYVRSMRRFSSIPGRSVPAFLDPDNQCLLVHLSETSGDVRVFPCGYCPGTKKHSGVHPGIQKKPVYRKQYPGTGKREKRLWCRAFRLPGRSSSRPDCGHLYSLFFRLAKIPSDGVPYTHFVLAALLISP